jgi:hypothetical protein
MVSPRRNRDRRPGRRPPFREPKPTILIVCEGQVTEPEYFRGFRNACRNPRVEIEIADSHGVPRTLVQTAKRHKQEAARDAAREKDDNLAYDSVWCVFDIDEHPNVPDAEQMARDNGIDLAVSNPCFELWLLLHFRDNPGMQHRATVQEMVAAYVPSYDGHVEYGVYSAGYSQAMAHAERMDLAADEAGESGRNPTTGVYKLTELIRGETAKP